MPITRLVLILALLSCRSEPEAPAWWRAQVAALKQRFAQLDAIRKRIDWTTAPVVDPFPSLAGVDPAAFALYHVELGDSSRPTMHHLDDGELRCILKIDAARYGGTPHFFDHDIEEAKRCVTWMLSLRYVAVADFDTHQLSIVSLEQPAVRMRIPFGSDDAVYEAEKPKGWVEARGRDYADARRNAESLHLAQVGRAMHKASVAGARRALANAAAR